MEIVSEKEVGVEVEVEVEVGKETERELREEVVEICPECGSPRLIMDHRRGELFCQECGLVIEETYLDAGPEWRFDQGEKRNRAGPPSTFTIHDKGISTDIGMDIRDHQGEYIPTKTRAQLFRLRRWQRRIRISNATERNLAFALSELGRMASALGLPESMRESAAVVYRKAVDKNLIRGKSIEGVVAAALYAACRQAGVPRTLDEIATYSRVDRKEIGRTYRYIARELGLNLIPLDPADYVPRFCTALGLSGRVCERAIEVIRAAEEKKLACGRSPTSVAAAAIYIASILEGEKRSQKEVAKLAGVTDVTIRNRYKEMVDKLNIIIVV